MISIVLGYLNRLEQTKKTLYSISKSINTDIEIICVDDFSNDDNRAELLHEQFPNLKIKVINLKDYFTVKNYCNPCIAYNIGFRFATGDKIIIQNPECYHFGDIIDYVDKNLTNDNYLSFHCYSLSKEDTENFYKTGEVAFNNYPAGYPGSCWYNHSEIRPSGYHFTSAITRKNLEELGGFDEEFAHGIGFDDDEFLARIKFKNLKIEFVKNPLVFHLYHENSFNTITSENIEKNRQLFLQTLENKKITANIDDKIKNKWWLEEIDKTIYFYWGGAPLSYLRFLSVYSFSRLNPDWKIKVYTSGGPNSITWEGNEQRYAYSGEDYFSTLSTIKNVEIINFDFKNTLVENKHHVYKSDFLRWKLLYENGGVWSDFDILYINPINNLIENNYNNRFINITVCPYINGIDAGKNTVGFILGSKNNNFLKTMLSLTNIKFESQYYQSIGSNLINNNFENADAINKNCWGANALKLNPKCVYSLDVSNFHYLYEPVNNYTFPLLNNPNVIGFHWYGGNEKFSYFENNFYKSKIYSFNTFLRNAYNKMLENSSKNA